MASEAESEQIPFKVKLNDVKQDYLDSNRAAGQVGYSLTKVQKTVEQIALEQVERRRFEERAEASFDEIADLVVGELEESAMADEQLAVLSQTRRVLRSGRTPSNMFGEITMDDLTDRIILKLLERTRSSNPQSPLDA